MKGQQFAEAPIVILATRIIEDISELCARMAVINRHEGEPGPMPVDRDTKGRVKGAKSDR